jgi:hypothetical protein
MTPARFWTAFVALGLAVEAFGLSRADRNDWTASPNIRRATRVDTRLGRNATIALVGAGAAWLAHHLAEIPPPKETTP